MKVHRQLLESRTEAAEPFQPSDGPLGGAPTAISFKVKGDGRIVPSLFVAFVRDCRPNVPGLQPVTSPLHTVALVGFFFSARRGLSGPNAGPVYAPGLRVDHLFVQLELAMPR
jgi:hypothetical protein